LIQNTFTDFEKYKDYHINKEYQVEMGYENYTMNEALKILLPNLTDKEIPSGFEVIGDIAHMNL